VANKQSAANEVVRATLTLIGQHRDFGVLGIFPSSLQGKKIRATLIEEFNNCCAYCSIEISNSTMEIDHLIPMNKSSVGLHMYGNLVPACSACNKAKHHWSLDEFAKSSDRVSPETIANLKSRAKKYGADLDVQVLREFVSDLYADISKLIESKRDEALKFLPEPSAVTRETAIEIQKKSEYDFSETARLYPLGSIVRAKKDGKVGVVVDYALEGDPGKRKPYVRFRVEDGAKPITRSPNQLERLG
jgi:hypothetical protein